MVGHIPLLCSYWMLVYSQIRTVATVILLMQRSRIFIGCFVITFLASGEEICITYPQATHREHTPQKQSNRTTFHLSYLALQ